MWLIGLIAMSGGRVHSVNRLTENARLIIVIAPRRVLPVAADDAGVADAEVPAAAFGPFVLIMQRKAAWQPFPCQEARHGNLFAQSRTALEAFPSARPIAR